MIGKTGRSILMALALMGGAMGTEPQLVDTDRVNTVLEDAITPMIDGTFHLTITNNPFPVEIDASQSPDLEVQDLIINDRQTAFSAKIAVRESDLPPLPVRGTLTVYALVPVLKIDVNKGALLTADHIDWQNIPKNRITTNHIMVEDDMVGMEVRSNRLLKGKPVRQHDLRQRPLVTKGGDVRLVYQTDLLSVETKAKALADGNKDDWIKVLNHGSGKILNAKVSQNGMVIIPDETFVEKTPVTQGIL